MEKVIYLGVFIAYFAVVRALFIRMEYRSEKRRKVREKREKVRNYETIDYTGFNPNTGRYEN
jgi:hypothetical protein